MVGGLLQHQGGAVTGGEDVLVEVHLVDVLPDVLCHVHGLVVGQLRIATEIGVGLGERRLLEREKPFDVPVLDVVGVGVDEDREVEVVGDESARLPRLKDVDPLDDEDVRPVYDPRLAADDVVADVGVDGDLEVLLPCGSAGDVRAPSLLH